MHLKPSRAARCFQELSDNRTFCVNESNLLASLWVSLQFLSFFFTPHNKKNPKQPLNLVIMAIQESDYGVVQFREEKEIRELTKKHLHHLTSQTFTTSPPISDSLLCHECTHIVRRKKSENTNFLITSARPRDLTFICRALAKKCRTHGVRRPIVIQL